MIGLPNAEKPVFRAYSIASPAWDEELEFFSIKVPDGPLTSHLQKIEPGDTVLMRQKSTGTLVLDALTPGKRLFMISTGTGIAPFASLVRDPETYEKFDADRSSPTPAATMPNWPMATNWSTTLGGGPADRRTRRTAGVTLYSTTTREIAPRMGRITRADRERQASTRISASRRFDPATDRVMICGSMHMLKDVKDLVEGLGFDEGSLSNPADFVVERAFVG